jgi:hypothetical protein
MGKDLFHSKTFWANALLAASTYIVPVMPPKYSLPVALGTNVALRLISGEAITSILGKIKINQ